MFLSHVFWSVLWSFVSWNISLCFWVFFLLSVSQYWMLKAVFPFTQIPIWDVNLGFVFLSWSLREPHPVQLLKLRHYDIITFTSLNIHTDDCFIYGNKTGNLMGIYGYELKSMRIAMNFVFTQSVSLYFSVWITPRLRKGCLLMIMGKKE